MNNDPRVSIAEFAAAMQARGVEGIDLDGRDHELEAAIRENGRALLRIFAWSNEQVGRVVASSIGPIWRSVHQVLDTRDRDMFQQGSLVGKQHWTRWDDESGMPLTLRSDDLPLNRLSDDLHELRAPTFSTPPDGDLTKTMHGWTEPRLLAWAHECGNIVVDPTEVIRLTRVAQRSKPQKMIIRRPPNGAG